MMIPAIAIQMDPLASLFPKTDTSIAIGLEAQKRGFQIFVYSVDQLVFDSEKGVKAVQGFWVKFLDSLDPFYEIISEKTEDLSSFSYIFIRQNPPYNLAYLTATHLLEKIPQLNQKTIILNNPKALREAPEKILPLRFPQWIPPTLITRQWSQVETFLDRYPKAVIKPLYEFGGSGVFLLEKGHSNNQSIVDLFLSRSSEHFIVQKFLDRIEQEGDKRIFMVHGKAKGAFTRIPQKGKILANMRSGGTPTPCDLTDKDHQICTTVGPVLKDMGLLLAGIDVIGGYLTEINVTSPTGFRVFYQLYGIDLIKDFWDQLS